MEREFLIRCPRLGGEVTLQYCFQEGGKCPCRRIVSCWQPFFPIEDHLKKQLTQEEWDKCFNTHIPDKYATLIELVENAAKNR